MVQDSETDDMSAWLLLAAVHMQKRSSLGVLVQLPVGEEYAAVEKHYIDRAPALAMQLEILIDNESGNGDNVRAATQMFFKEAVATKPRVPGPAPIAGVPAAPQVSPTPSGPCEAIYIHSHTEARSFVGKYTRCADGTSFESGMRRLFQDAKGHWAIALDSQSLSHGRELVQLRALDHPHCSLPTEVSRWEMLVRAESYEWVGDQWRPKVPSTAEWRPLEQILGSDNQWRESLYVLPTGPKCEACDVPGDTDGLAHCRSHMRLNGAQNQNCPQYLRAREFIESLGVEEFLDHG